MGAENTGFTNKPIWGLPACLIEAENRKIPIISMMQRYGLNRDEKRDLASTVKQAPFPEQRGFKLSDVDLRILSIYSDPYQRFYGFWSALNSLKDPKNKGGTRRIFQAPDYALLDTHSSNFLKQNFDREAFLQKCPVWTEIATNIELNLHKLPGTSFRLYPEAFMAWLPFIEELSQWASLDKAKRNELACTVFALSSISLSEWFVRDAIRRCPDLIAEFEQLLNDKKYQDAQASTDNSANHSREAVTPYGCETGWQERWKILSDRLSKLSLRIRDEPCSEIVSELKQVHDDFQILVPFLPTSTKVFFDQFNIQLDLLLEALRSLHKTSCLTWLDESLLDQICARWKIALSHVEMPDGIRDLTGDFSRAEEDGERNISCYRAEFEKLIAVQGEIGQTDLELNGLVSSIQRRALKYKRTEQKKDEVRLESSLQTIETEVLSAYSPYGDIFDYSVDYTALLSEEEMPQAGTAGVSINPVEPEITQEVDCAPSDSVLPSSVENSLADFNKLSEPEEILLPSDPKEVNDVKSSKTSPSVVAIQERGNEPLADTSNQDNCGKEFSQEAGELCRPLWSALSKGRISLAYHIAIALEQAESSPKVPPSHLLSAVCLADELVMPDGAITLALERNYTMLTEKSFLEVAPRAWQISLNLLLAAATMRPILLSPRSGAAAVARYVHLDSAHQGVYRLIQLLLQYSDRLQGFRIEEATFKQAKTQSAWQKDSDLLLGDVKYWLERAPHQTMLFAAASKVWQRWQKAGGLISNLLTPVASNDFRRIKEVQNIVAELSNPEGIHRRVQQTDRVELERRKGEEIHSRAMAQLARGVEEAVSLARRWIVLIESRPHDSDLLSKQLGQLRNDFTPLQQQIARDLTSQIEGDDWGMIIAARRAVNRSISGLADLFDPDKPAKLAEASPEELLGNDLLFVSDVDLNSAWKPEVSGSSLIDPIRIALLDGINLENAFDRRIDRHDLEGSEALCRIAEIELAPLVSSQLKVRWQREMSDHRVLLRQQLDNVREKIEDGLAYGFITEAERAEFDGRLVQYESRLDQVRRFGSAFKDLAGIADTIQSGREKKTREIQSRLDEIARLDTDVQSIGIVQNSINSGDVLSANEFLQRLENHESIAGTSIQALDRFNYFFPDLANSIDTELQSINAKELRLQVREAQNFAGLDFSQLEHEAPMRQSAADMVGVWMDLKARKRVEREPLSRLLQAIGFGVLEVQVGQAIGSRVECDLRAEPIEDRTVCPIPYFGTHANGRYRVICVWQRPAEDEIVKLAGDSTISKPTLVLYFGRLSERKRREASRLAKQNRRSFLLIDETLLVFLTAESRSRLTALFEVALPFSYSAPYDSTSSVVPSEMFFGRSLELQAIQGQNGRCFIYGGRQLGKTALLRKAERSFHSPKNGRFAKWIDLRAEGVGVNKTPSEIWQCIAREFRNIGIIPEDTPDPNPNVNGRIEGFILLIKQTLAANNDRRVLLLLDEADRFFDQDGRTGFQETARLKGLMEDTERRFKVVFAGLHNVLRMTERANHPLAHLGEPIKVGPLLEGQEWMDAEELIRKPFEAAGFEFESRSLVTRILAQTNYYPSLIQLYCTHLLRQMLSSIQADPNLPGPRYRIVAKHVDAAYRSRALRDEIRTKFQLTLQLDPRYEVIAYTLAYGAMDGWSSLTDGIQTREIKAKVTLWWPEGFNDTRDLEFRVLLDEMVGLGVLRQTREGWFSLRNPNILLLLGTHDEIEDVLVKDREPPQEFESNVFRSRLPDDPSSVKRNPLTFEQLSNLQRRKNAVAVLTGCAAGGIDDLIPFFRKTVEGKYLTILDGTTDFNNFLKALDKLNDRPSDGTTILVVSGDTPWNTQWLTSAWKKVSGFSSKDRFAHVLFLADPTTSFQMIKDGDTTIPQEVAGMTLHPWHDTFLRQWLEDCQLPNDLPNRQEVRQMTGNWPGLLYMLIRSSREGNRLQDRLSALNQEMTDNANTSKLLKLFGLELPEPREVLTMLATLEEPTTEQDLASLGEFDIDRVNRDIRWAELMGLVKRVGVDTWDIDPIVQFLLKL